MRILLIGEYSRLHNSLKEGLLKLGHNVILTSSGDSFKNFPSDYLYIPKVCNFWFFGKIRNLLLKVIPFDLEELERGIRFYMLIKHFKNFDYVQLINEKPIQTFSFFELFLLKKIFKNNQKVFLLSAGVDKINVDFMLNNKNFKSILQPYFTDPSLKKEYDYVFAYLKKNHQKTHQFVYDHCRGIIASDIDYVIPLIDNKKFLGLIPNPIISEQFDYINLNINDRIIIFLGINRGNYHQKGIPFFRKSLEKIAEKYTDKVEIIIAENIPYKKYMSIYDKCHILLDQTFANDQGYNALEAMSRGKVVFTGAELAFENEYRLTEKVAINAKANVDYLVAELSQLVENPAEILKISERAKAFILKEHNYIDIAEKYMNVWEKN